MKTMTRYLFLSFLIGNFIGIGSYALAQKTATLSEQEKTTIGTGTSGAPAPTSTTVKKLPAATGVKKKPAAATTSAVTSKPPTTTKKTSTLPVTPSYTPPAAKTVTKQPSSGTATGVSAKPSTSIRKTATLPVTPSYTPPATSAPSTAAGMGTALQGQGYKPPTSPFVKPSYTPPAVSVPSKTIGVGTAVQGQGIQTPSGAYVIPDYDPPRSGPAGSGTPIGQPGSVTATPRSGSVPLFPVSVGTGSGGQEQGGKTPGALVVPSSIGGKVVAPGSEAAPAGSGSAPPPAVDSSERLRLLKEKYGKGGTIWGDVQSDDASQKATGASDGKSGEGGAAASGQATGAGGTASGGKAGKTAAAAAIEASAAASAASGIVGAGPKKASEGKGQSPEITGAGQQGETATDREKDLRERYNIPEDVPIKSTAEALGFAKQIELLGGKLTPETWRLRKEKGSDEAVGKQVRETFEIPDDVPVGNPSDAIGFARDVQSLTGENKPGAWRTRHEKGSEAAITGILRENNEIPEDAVVGGSKDIWDILTAAATVGDGRVTPEMWRDVGKRGKDKVIDGMIEDTFGVSRPGNMSREDLLKGLAEGDRLGVPRQDRPSFIDDWNRQRNGGITLEELLKKWQPGAKPGIDRGGLPGDGLPGGPGSGSSGLPGLPTGPGGGVPGVQGVLDAIRGGAGIGAAAGGSGRLPGVPGSGSSGLPTGPGGGVPGVQGVLDAIRGGAGIGAAAGQMGGGVPSVPGSGSSGTGIPGAPGGGSSGTGSSLGGGRGAGLLDTLTTGTGIGTAGQAGGGQGQSSSGTSTTPGTGISGSGSGSGGSSSGGSGSGGAGSGSGGVGGAGSGDNTASGPSTGGYVTYTDDGGFDLTATDGQGTVTVHFEPNTDADGNPVGGYYGIKPNGDTVTMESKPPEGAVNSGGDQEETYVSSDQGSSTTSSGSSGSGTSSSGSTTSTGGTQGTGEEEGQSGMYNPDDDSLYRRRGMSAEERAKAVEESQKIKPVDGGRGGEGGGQRRTGLKVSDVNTMDIMKSKTDPYITPNPDADQGEHSGPIPVGDERGNVERPVPDGDTTAPGFGSMGGATRPGGSTTPGGFDPNVAGQQ